MKHRALNILEDLVAIHSVNPALEAGAPGEAGMADYIETFAQNLRLDVRRQQVLPGRDNVVVSLDAGRPRTLLFESHMDTVGLGSMPNALQPRYHDGHLYGRGSCDTKGTMAGMLYALERATAQPEALSCNVKLCAAIDEEQDFEGVKAFCEAGGTADAAVVGEPTEMKLIVAHKGIARFKVLTHGVAAHSSVPHQGHSAIYDMMEVLAFLRLEEQRLSGFSHPLCGSPTIVAGRIYGGTQINIVPEQCTIEIDRRLIPGEDSLEAMQDFTQRLNQHLAQQGLQCQVVDLLRDDALNTDPRAAIVQCASEVARQMNLDPTPLGVPYGTDASKLHRISHIPTIVFGPGSIRQAHTADEYVPVAEVEQAAEFYATLTRSFGRD